MIAVAGSIGYDIFLSIDQPASEAFLEQKDTALIPLKTCLHSYGGNGANICWYLAALGERPLLLSTAGKDGERYLERLRAAGISTKAVKIFDDIPTTTVVFLKDGKDAEYALFHAEASDRRKWTTEHLPEDAYILHVAPSKPAFAMDALSSRANGDRVSVFDPGQELGNYSKKEIQECLGMASLTVVNEGELELMRTITGESEDFLFDLCPRFIVTHGKKGSRIIDGDASAFVNACSSGRPDKTTIGAGDAFRAGLLYGLDHSLNLEQSAMLGAAIAAEAVSVADAQAPSFTKEDINMRMKDAYGEKAPEL